MSLSPWLYRGREVTEEIVGDHVGFCYLITCKVNGKKYIGKKLLAFRRRKKVKGRERRKIVTTASDWPTYFGSSKELLEDVDIHGEGQFTREILRFCDSKSECNYWEAKFQFDSDAIIRDDYYNSWISVKVHRSKALTKT